MADVLLVESRSSRQHSDGQATIPRGGSLLLVTGSHSADPSDKAAEIPVGLVAQRQ